MANGKPGDHPFSDILHYGSSEFGEPVDGMVKRLADHPGFSSVRDEVADLLWSNSPMGRQSEKADLVEDTRRALAAIEGRLTKI